VRLARPWLVERQREPGAFEPLDQVPIGVRPVRAAAHLGTAVADERLLDVQPAASRVATRGFADGPRHQETPRA
jgi:hypothetical protein